MPTTTNEHHKSELKPFQTHFQTTQIKPSWRPYITDDRPQAPFVLGSVESGVEDLDKREREKERDEREKERNQRVKERDRRSVKRKEEKKK